MTLSYAQKSICLSASTRQIGLASHSQDTHWDSRRERNSQQKITLLSQHPPHLWPQDPRISGDHKQHRTLETSSKVHICKPTALKASLQNHIKQYCLMWRISNKGCIMQVHRSPLRTVDCGSSGWPCWGWNVSTLLRIPTVPSTKENWHWV